MTVNNCNDNVIIYTDPKYLLCCGAVTVTANRFLKPLSKRKMKISKSSQENDHKVKSTYGTCLNAN